MDLKLQGKKALIVGGSRGIGKAVARQLALEGVDCTICSRNESTLKIAAEELAQETSRNIYPIVADTTDPDSILNLVEKSAAKMGSIDILINSGARVGGHEPEDFNSIKEELIIKDFEEKYMGYFRSIRAVAPHMIENKWGRIINISGLAARIGGNYFSSGPRNASVVHLTKSASMELGKHGINVNAIYPGIVDTETFRDKVTNEEAIQQVKSLNSLGRLITPEEIAYVVTFLASPLSASITGEVIPVTGGIGNTVYF
ncbi:MULTISPECIES: SDR family NAD(P)-dependent oxidoreductase [Bacillaceae]|uniref:SDR family NAD(P)-dependent oxidoreductase n=1 Tax=Bacillaceae TaxID=186817 RepID=UPI000BEC4070|nr:MULTISPECIES: SDR family oxidoreductase [unclassified Bacillus (in: firmicutes)]PEC49383.1 SDR family oxidoreductase [Bacillus sp. AFS096315]PFM82371.1 SDR family oxidoreductase [Bacillus sp. AFS077874]